MAFALMIAPRPFPAHISSLPPNGAKLSWALEEPCIFFFKWGYGGSAPMFKTGP